MHFNKLTTLCELLIITLPELTLARSFIILITMTENKLYTIIYYAHKNL